MLYNIDWLSPSIIDLVMYIKFMANSYTSPASTKNYLSGAKYWVTVHGGNPAAFSALETGEMIKAVVADSHHIPSPALPLHVSDIAIVCQFLDSNPVVIKAIKPCILLTFACMLRSSNTLSPNLTVWAGAHTLLASDISVVNGSLAVVIRSTKTTSRNKPVLLQVLPAASPEICPVKAWTDYEAALKPWPFGPAFVTNSGLPLTPGPMVAAMRAALRAAGATNIARISMHSLRRGGAQAAFNSGSPRQEIMKHGIWSTQKGLGFYLNPASTEVPRAISASLAS